MVDGLDKGGKMHGMVFSFKVRLLLSADAPRLCGWCVFYVVAYVLWFLRRVFFSRLMLCYTSDLPRVHQMRD